MDHGIKSYLICFTRGVETPFTFLPGLDAFMGGGNCEGLRVLGCKEKGEFGSPPKPKLASRQGVLVMQGW